VRLLCFCALENEKRKDRKRHAAPHARLIKGLTRFATFADYPLMKRAAVLSLLAFAVVATGLAQQATPSPTSPKRGWLSRLFHPRTSEPLPEYNDPQLRGLVLSLQLSPQPVKLSEVRQMDVKLTITNKSKRPITLDFPNAQRFEIHLRNSAEKILTSWSENHSFAESPGTILINPQEHIEYAETIATRELTPNKVFIAEVFFPQYLLFRFF
jgi:hypothetical protein